MRVELPPLIGVKSNEARGIWPQVEPYLKRITDKQDTGCTTDDLLHRIETQRMQLWVQKGVVFITEITVYPQWVGLHIPYAAGDNMEDWFDRSLEYLEGFAREKGCKYISATGRKGWIRQGKARGYKEAFFNVRKEL